MRGADIYFYSFQSIPFYSNLLYLSLSLSIFSYGPKGAASLTGAFSLRHYVVILLRIILRILLRIYTIYFLTFYSAPIFVYFSLPKTPPYLLDSRKPSLLRSPSVYPPIFWVRYIPPIYRSSSLYIRNNSAPYIRSSSSPKNFALYTL